MTAFYKKPYYRARQFLMGAFLGKPQPTPMELLGADSSLKLCQNIARFGMRNILVVTDKPLLELGVLEPALETLRQHGVQTVVYDGVLPDPTQDVVDQGIDCFHSNNCDSVLAFGGGSSIDTAKVVALAAANNCRAADCIGAGKAKLPAAPLFAIPTTAGTGSEATFIAVVSDNETHAKDGVIDKFIIPKAAALDPALMQGLPAHITAATGLGRGP